MHAFIEGRVQGVGFRYFSQHKAEMLGITGWVRNCWDGRVELSAEGTQEEIDRFCRYLEQGPPSSIVKKINVDYSTASGRFQTFSVRPNV
jgi:acylphosphatase